MRMFLEPADGWVFRGNRPFGEGGDNHSESAFPPSPSVVAGALRTAILRQRGVDLDRLKRGERCLPDDLAEYLGYAPGPGRPFVPGRFHIRELELGLMSDSGGVLTMRTAPADLVESDVEDTPGRDCTPDGERPLGLLAPVDPAEFGGMSSAPQELLPWCSDLARFKRTSGVMCDGDWNLYLAGKPPTGRPIGMDKLFQRELRVGIGMSTSFRTVEKGKLYTTEHVIACDQLDCAGGVYQRPGLVADVPGLDEILNMPTVVRLGGDGRMARVVPAKGNGHETDPMAGSPERRFRLILRTPLPIGDVESALRLEAGRISGMKEEHLEARVLAMAGDPAEFLGGFDLIYGAPKPSVLALPSGTVFWCEAVQGTAGDFYERYHRGSLCAQGSARWAEGFGLAVVAAWI